MKPWILLPWTSFAFIYLAFIARSFSFNQRFELRVNFLSSAIIWSLLLIFFTESLSFFKLISFQWVAAMWVITTILTGTIFFSIAVRHQFFSHIKFRLSPVPFSSYLIISGMFLLLALLAVIAFFAPPYQWDDLTYHMPRIMYWIQHNSLAYYPTHFLPQLYQPPFSEFVILHYWLLSGSDQF